MLREALTRQGLSNREAEVAGLVSTGLSNKEVADRLFVTEKTVKFHLTNIYKKMNIRSRAQLIVWSLPHMNFSEGVNAQTQQPAGATVNPQQQNTVIGGQEANAISNDTSAAPAGIPNLSRGQFGLGGNGSSDIGQGGGAVGA